jgi:cardiolipin synthase (CMP-forming)
VNSKFTLKNINTVANYLSLFRILLAIPIYIFLDYINVSYHYRLILGSILILAVTTDLLDGYFARRNNEITEIGKIIDPLADKLCISIIIIKLFLIGEISAFYFWVIILRDVIIFSGGIVVSRIIGKVLPSNRLGKITAFSIGVFILALVLGIKEYEFYYQFLLITSLVLSFASLIGYAIRAYENIRYYKNENV